MEAPEYMVARHIAALSFARNCELHKKPAFLTLVIVNYVLMYQVYPTSEKDTTPYQMCLASRLIIIVKKSPLVDLSLFDI